MELLCAHNQIHMRQSFEQPCSAGLRHPAEKTEYHMGPIHLGCTIGWIFPSRVNLGFIYGMGPRASRNGGLQTAVWVRSAAGNPPLLEVRREFIIKEPTSLKPLLVVMAAWRTGLGMDL